MQNIFILLSIIGALYFIFIKKGFNIFSLAYFSAIIYFCPLYFGYIKEPTLVGDKYMSIEREINNNVYLVGIIVLLSIFIGALFLRNKNTIKHKKEYMNLGTKIFLFYFTIFLWGALIYIYIINGGAIFSGKLDVLGKSQISSIFLRSSTVYFVASCLSKNKFYITSSILIFLISFFIGIRSFVAIGILAYLLILMSNRKEPLYRLIKPKLLILVVLFGYIMINGKYIYSNFQVDGFKKLLDVIFDYKITLENIKKSEPFTTQMILNKTIEYDFHVGILVLKDALIDFFYIDKLYHLHAINFNSVFTNTFFKEINYGLGYNIWAEAISIGGLFYLIVFCIIFSTTLYFLDMMINNVYSIEFKSLISVIAAFTAFYIHRNSLSNILTINKTIMIFIVAIILLSMVTKKILSTILIVKKEKI